MELFSKDLDYQNSISFSIMQIGELSAGLSESFRNETAQIVSWHAIKAMRNNFAHKYNSMSLEVIWKTAKEDIPQLLFFIADTIEQSQTDHINYMVSDLNLKEEHNDSSDNNINNGPVL